MVSFKNYCNRYKPLVDDNIIIDLIKKEVKACEEKN